MLVENTTSIWERLTGLSFGTGCSQGTDSTIMDDRPPGQQPSRTLGISVQPVMLLNNPFALAPLE